jgi:hypothetical protein
MSMNELLSVLRISGFARTIVRSDKGPMRHEKEQFLDQSVTDSEFACAIEDMLALESKLPGQRLRQAELEQRLMAVARPVLNDLGLSLVQYEIARDYVRELSRVLRRHVGVPLVMDVRALLLKYSSGGVALRVLGNLLSVSYRALAR